MDKKFNLQGFLKKYPFESGEISENNISVEALDAIYADFLKVRDNYETQAEFISTILRTHPKIHSVKSRVKNPERLIEKIIRKTSDRKEKYGEDFKFSVDNYKEEINDLIGIRAIHIFKEEWETIHKFILNTWKVIEITANIRDGDDTSCFEELGIEIKSRKSGYRSVHYLIEFYPTSQKVIAEIQVRTIFEEGYGEIDHKLRYSHKEIPEVLASNLLLFNRIAGSADEMASLINLLSKNLKDLDIKYKKVIQEKDEEILKLRSDLKGD
ncbi:ppGpp synthetase catalytic domain-containing protein (RelA/SpoT-type nucleotidyltranferase) [Clostridium cavendishii DSM 21758]|uniref:PpGpp synthetase catalytic domain-containing protein (RelA/SpoT-type nucleotidyltranferase) n=1 Tax=Clostridium cavendishii DSM 21758 TaxID=1121302 RepID=A0A1M6FLU1_9CLOT|nr:GTP pyrophosphokinase [Clostridium cavendishii]SHI98623.1 ppGpp synthetase catalytic domain-containing protein (RelA/SpoT-type nucleotidyltranferase) [Clostridium cavendishii DSM 21758]